MGKRSTALKLLVDEEQEIPHEIMRFVAMGDELVLQSKLGNNWETGSPQLIHRTHISTT
jgi:hypothetical protein